MFRTAARWVTSYLSVAYSIKSKLTARSYVFSCVMMTQSTNCVHFRRHQTVVPVPSYPHTVVLVRAKRPATCIRATQYGHVTCNDSQNVTTAETKVWYRYMGIVRFNVPLALASTLGGRAEGAKCRRRRRRQRDAEGVEGMRNVDGGSPSPA